MSTSTSPSYPSQEATPGPADALVSEEEPHPPPKDAEEGQDTQTECDPEEVTLARLRGYDGVPITLCAKCDYAGEQIDVLFMLKAAAMLVPMSYGALRKFLSRHPEEYPPRYMRTGSKHLRTRVLTGREIATIRERILKGPITPKNVLRFFRYWK